MSFIQQVVLHQEYHLDPGPGHDFVLVPDHGHYFRYQDQNLKQVCEGLSYRFTTVLLLVKIFTFEFATLRIRLAAYWQSPKLAPWKGQAWKNEKYIKRIFSYSEYWVEASDNKLKHRGFCSYQSETDRQRTL